MSRKVATPGRLLGAVIAMGALAVLVNAPLYAVAWEILNRRCDGPNGASIGAIRGLCVPHAEEAGHLIPIAGAKTDRALPLGRDRPKNAHGASHNSSMEDYEAALARDRRVFRASSVVRKSGDVRERLAVGNETLEVVAGCRDMPKNEPDLCQSLVWRGKELLSDRYVSIIDAYPPSGRPAIVNITNYGGGTCCVPTANILDLRQPDPHVMQIPDLGEDLEFTLVSPDLLVIAGADTSDEDPDEEPVIASYLYRLDGKRLISAPFDGKTDFGGLMADGPGRLFDDGVVRAALKGILGGRLGEFRRYMPSPSSPTLIDYRYLVWTGCASNACRGMGGAYVFDIATGDAQAFWFDRGGALQSAGSVSSSFDMNEFLEDWFDRAGYSRDSE